MPDYQIGASREESVTVGNDHAITFLGPDGPRVLSTPKMIGCMEGTCRNLVLSMLDAGHDTLGTHVNVSHCAAAPMGSSVCFRAELTAVNNRRLEFNVKATLGDKIIGEGTHQRAVIDIQRFKDKVQESIAKVGVVPSQ